MLVTAKDCNNNSNNKKWQYMSSYVKFLTEELNFEEILLQNGNMLL